jgi:hypothetical protein
MRSDIITHKISHSIKQHKSGTYQQVVLNSCRLQEPCIGKEVWAGAGHTMNGCVCVCVCVLGHVYRNVSTAQLPLQTDKSSMYKN